MSLIEECRRRIVTTSVGSFPRRHALSELLLARLTKQPYDPNVLARETTEAVAEVVRQQLTTGLDVVSDGEQSKTSFQHYISDRLTGLEPIRPAPGERRTRENMAFPSFLQRWRSFGLATGEARLHRSDPLCRPEATG